MARIKAFTLVEFFTATAVVALLAAVFAPITVQARQAAATATTASNLRLIGMASNMYSNDYDGGVVMTQWGKTDAKHLWSVSLTPYVSSRNTFFDPTRTIPTTSTVTIAGVALPWYYGVNLSINDAGYAGSWYVLGNTCTGRKSYYNYSRSTATMDEPNKRVAFSPTTYAGTPYGVSSFHTYESNWINTTILPTTFSYTNTVYNTNTLYPGGKIPVVHADGSAGTLSRSDFKSTVEAPNLAAYCAWMSTEGRRTWGAFWNQS